MSECLPASIWRLCTLLIHVTASWGFPFMPNYCSKSPYKGKERFIEHYTSYKNGHNLYIDCYLSWKDNINYIEEKIARNIGILEIEVY